MTLTIHNVLEMATGAQNEMTELLPENLGKLMILIDSVDQGNQETHQLWRCILEELKAKETTESSSKRLESATENSNEVEQAVTEGIKSLKRSKVASNRLLTVKEGMSSLWQNTLNLRKRVFEIIS